MKKRYGVPKPTAILYAGYGHFFTWEQHGERSFILKIFSIFCSRGNAALYDFDNYRIVIRYYLAFFFATVALWPVVCFWQQEVIKGD